MAETKRFIVNEYRKVIDTLDPSKPTGYCHEKNWTPWFHPRRKTRSGDADDSQDDTHLREIVLSARLGVLIHDFVFDPPLPGPRADNTDHRWYLSREFAACNSMQVTLVDVIRATKLDGLEIDASKRVNGTPKQKTGLLHQTSISLFLDDVECLLRDLYGNIDTVAFDDTMSAVRTIVEEFTRCTRRDVFEEHENARAYDICLGNGIPEGYGISENDYCSGREGLQDILKRSRAVLKDEASFNPYTVRFAMYCAQNFRDDWSW